MAAMRMVLGLLLAVGCSPGSVEPLEGALEFEALPLTLDQAVDTRLGLDTNGREQFAARGDELLYAALEGSSGDYLLAYSADRGRTWTQVWQDSRRLTPLMIFDNGSAAVAADDGSGGRLYLDSGSLETMQLPTGQGSTVHQGLDTWVSASPSVGRIDLPITNSSGYDVRGGPISGDPGDVQQISGHHSVVILTVNGIYETADLRTFTEHPRPESWTCNKLVANDHTWLFPSCPGQDMLTISIDKGQSFETLQVGDIVASDVLTGANLLRVDDDGRFRSRGWVSDDGRDWHPLASIHHPWVRGEVPGLHRVTSTGLHLLGSTLSDDPTKTVRLLPGPWDHTGFYGPSGNAALIGLPMAISDDAIAARGFVAADQFASGNAVGWATYNRANGGIELHLDGRAEYSNLSAHRWHIRRAPDGRVARMDDHTIAWSDDDGLSFGEATVLWPDAPGPPPVGALWAYGPILEHDGQLVVGALAAVDALDLRSAVLVSDDGASWTPLEHDIDAALVIPTASHDGVLWAMAFGQNGEDLGIGRSDDARSWDLFGLDHPLPIGVSPSGRLVGLLHVQGEADPDVEVHLSNSGKTWQHWATTPAASLHGVPVLDDEGTIWAAVERADRMELYRSSAAVP